MMRRNRGNMNDIDTELAMIKRRRQMVQEQRQMLEENSQLDLLQGQAGSWQQNMRYNNIQQPFNQFNEGNGYNQYLSAYDNNSNGYQHSDDYQSKVWQHNVAPKPQMYGNSGFNDRTYQSNGPQQLMMPRNNGGPRFNRNVNRFPGSQRQQPRFANATKPVGVKGKTQLAQGRVVKPKVVANPLNKSKFPKKMGPGYSGPVWEGPVRVRGPRQVGPVVHDKMYLVTRKTPNPKLNGRLELCLGEILREVKENVGKSGLDIKLTFPLVKTIKEFIRNRIRKAMIGKNAHTVSYVLNIYRNRHPRIKDVMFVRNLMDKVQREAAAKVGADSVSSPDPKSLTKDIAKQKSGGAADITGDDAVNSPQDEEEKEYLFQKMYTQMVTSAQLNKLLLKVNDLLKAEAKEGGQEEETADESQTEEEDKNTEGEGDAVTGEEEGMEVEKKEVEEGEETAPSKEEKMDRLELLIVQKLPFILPRFKNLILAILNNQPIPKHYTNAPKSKLFMVKLLGKPTLPKRVLLSHFLMPYNVLNIKKLKSRGNVLIIGCGTEEDRDKLLAASGSTIENIKLHITPCPDAKPTPNQTNVGAATTSDEENKDVTIVEAAGNGDNTVDLCDDNEEAQNGTEQEMEGDEDQNGQAESEVIDAQGDNSGKAGPVAADTAKGNPGQEVKKEVVGTPSKTITTRRSSRFPK